MKLDRIDDFASKLSANLLKSVVLPGGLLGWLSRPLTERIRRNQRAQRVALAQNDSSEQGRDTAVSLNSRVSGGPVILLGGHPVPDEAVVEIIHLSGGRSAKVAIIPVGADEQQVAGAAAMRLLTRFGMRKTQIMEIQNRAQADDPVFAATLAGYDAVVLCGENSELGYERLRGTASEQAVQRLNQSGKLIVGLSGGAGLLAERVLVTGADRTHPAPGLAIVSAVLLQVGDSPKTSFSRLIKALDQVETLSLAVAVDAGSALVLKSGGARVLGDASVTFLDASNGTSSDLSVSGKEPKVLVLGTGSEFSLATRRLNSTSKDSVPGPDIP